MNELTPQDRARLEAGTGFMASLAETIRAFERKGYTENLVPRFDHFELHSGRERLAPGEFVLDEVRRFENTSDPDDQSILYAISAPAHGLKGLYVDSYGTYHDELSERMLRSLSAQV